MNRRKILNLGCGRRLIKDAINVDLLDVHVENYIREDVLKFMREKGYLEEFDEIYMFYVLEHFTLSEAIELLAYCFEALKCGGRLVILTDDFDSIVERYLELKKKYGELRAYLWVHYGLYSSEEKTHHKMCPVPELLKMLLGIAGFLPEDIKIRRKVGSYGVGMLVEAIKRCRGQSEGNIINEFSLSLLGGDES